MVRGLAVLLFLLTVPSIAAVQEPGLLRIRIVSGGPGQTPAPVRRHALLISDNPATTAPRRVVTSQDGTVEVRLAPGNYTVESDQPAIVDAVAYRWMRIVEVAAGAEIAIEFTTRNAAIEPAAAAASGALADAGEDRASLAARWQESVAGVWTPTAHASGFVVDAGGLVVTSARSVGNAAGVEVQFSPALKLAGQVLVSDPTLDVAVVRIDPGRATSVSPVPLGCGNDAPSLSEGDALVAIDAPLRREKGATAGLVSLVDQRVIEADIATDADGFGGPVFTTQGVLAGMTSATGELRGRGNVRVVPAIDVCRVVEQARAKAAGEPPSGEPLPVEPIKPIPTRALDDAIAVRSGNLKPYQAASSDFDIAFLTPVHVYAGRQSRRPAPLAGPPDAAWLQARLVSEFGNWSAYVEDIPPVLMIRVTPKLVESFWAKIARGAAYTQGVSIPALVRVRSGFSSMRLFCGEAEVTPIHPFVIEEEISDTETFTEGLHVFDPAALSPECGTVRIALYSQEEPAKADTRTVDAKVVRQVWDDFARYRAQR